MHCTGTPSKYSRSTASRRAANIIRGGVGLGWGAYHGEGGEVEGILTRFAIFDVTRAVLECFCSYNFEPLLITFQGCARTTPRLESA